MASQVRCLAIKWGTDKLRTRLGWPGRWRLCAFHDFIPLRKMVTTVTYVTPRFVSLKRPSLSPGYNTAAYATKVEHGACAWRRRSRLDPGYDTYIGRPTICCCHKKRSAGTRLTTLHHTRLWLAGRPAAFARVVRQRIGISYA